MKLLISTALRARQKYESPGCARAEPVLCAGPPHRKVEITAGNRENERLIFSNTLGGLVKRNFVIVGIAALAIAGAVYAQNAPGKKTSKKGAVKGSSAAAARGKAVFDKSCGICHYAESDAKKIGPGLKGLSKRGTFSVNNSKVTDENLKNWIENGDSLMPPFKDNLEAAQITDVIAYVKTL
jgi:mono/diheme cytochrome c family protein